MRVAHFISWPSVPSSWHRSHAKRCPQHGKRNHLHRSLCYVATGENTVCNHRSRWKGTPLEDAQATEQMELRSFNGGRRGSYSSLQFTLPLKYVLRLTNTALAKPAPRRRGGCNRQGGQCSIRDQLAFRCAPVRVAVVGAGAQVGQRLPHVQRPYVQPCSAASCSRDARDLSCC